MSNNIEALDTATRKTEVMPHLSGQAFFLKVGLRQCSEFHLYRSRFPE
ncbi:MAG: hypothetical protein R3F50_19160 [Gammaproteobacteria bacterium]